MINSCLVCGGKLPVNSKIEYHPRCAKKLFGVESPVLPYSLDDIDRLASESASSRISVPGVQPKLSVHLVEESGTKRFTIVGLWGSHILKPPVERFPGLPENEDAVMRCAELARIEVVPHGLIRFASGELAYITKRIDRRGSEQIHMEDFCQLSGKMTEEKYRGSLENATKVIGKYSSDPGYDMIRLFDIAVFSFLTGNADMHLKNYSLIRDDSGGMRLAPAYDLVSTALAMPEDIEEYALTINGKKSRFDIDDFRSLSRYCGIPDRVFENELLQFGTWRKKVFSVLDNSFLKKNDLDRLKEIISNRCDRLGL